MKKSNEWVRFSEELPPDTNELIEVLAAIEGELLINAPAKDMRSAITRPTWAVAWRKKK